jgi:uncharacterized RDD family membrane protein YckC
MIAVRAALVAAVLLFTIFGSTVPGQAQPIDRLPTESQGRVFEQPRSYPRSIVRVGQSYTLPAGNTVWTATVILGDARIEGFVERDVVVIGGRTELAPTARIRSDLAVIGGDLSISEGAEVNGDIVVIGGDFTAPTGFAPRGESMVVASTVLGGRIEPMVPWLTRGLLWGRPIVPGLSWIWPIVGLFFLVYLALNLLFNGAVRACADVLAARPLSSFMAGLLVMLLLGPICLLLAVSLVGIAVVPLLLCAVFVAGLIGKVAVMRWTGRSAIAESDDSQLQGMRSLAIGFAVLTVAYMVPLIGFATMALVGVLGLGGATLAFLAGYRRENPQPRRPPAVPPPSVEHPAVPPPRREPVMPEATAFADIPPPLAAPVVGGPAAAIAATNLIAFPHAAFLDRLAAFILDVFLVIITREMLRWFPPIRYGGADALIFLLVAYHIGFWTWKGTTIGGIICQLRLVRIDGLPLRFVDSLVRGLSGIFSIAALGLGGLWILRDPERQAWHDRIAGTYVVKVPRNWPI